MLPKHPSTQQPVLSPHRPSPPRNPIFEDAPPSLAFPPLHLPVRNPRTEAQVPKPAESKSPNLSSAVTVPTPFRNAPSLPVDEAQPLNPFFDLIRLLASIGSWTRSSRSQFENFSTSRRLQHTLVTTYWCFPGFGTTAVCEKAICWTVPRLCDDLSFVSQTRQSHRVLPSPSSSRTLDSTIPFPPTDDDGPAYCCFCGSFDGLFLCV
ncbi:hypothetical protein JMJ77_0011807 [Colletotrichum scovillei]|uniref:Uncharacterized protein n=1 Tax=Colletotrichum scovillei TaxID=1209932 RepID=A0A9P7QXI0_9PEZI|nr:hypothetical protein JMJ77_0011807 [Colletotrichum scovillei]KAG7046088.1 hypothetical protein JMJ78_0011157 [Colletotrichum scovillei]KAG7063436.1 hypothetical protein JMJ76_0005902 [Colletotrichum scovillei]